MKNVLAAALGYAQRDWAVFPLHGIVRGRCTCGRRDCSSPGKHPLTRHGLKDATTDRAVIEEWWERWPSANIGVATGEASGIVAIDTDLPLALASLDRVLHKLPSTLTGLTGGGGVHLIYRARFQSRSVGPAAATSVDGEDPGQSRKLRCTTGRLPGIKGSLPGIDLRADGGCVVVPPSLHASGNRYEWLDPAADIVDAPAWLQEPPRHETPAAPPSPPRYSSGEGTAYGLAALDNALASLAQAPVGQRNHTLNRVAFNLARLVAGGHLLESAARAELTRVALAIGLNSWETARTIGSAFGAGLTQPRVAPHRLGSS